MLDEFKSLLTIAQFAPSEKQETGRKKSEKKMFGRLQSHKSIKNFITINYNRYIENGRENIETEKWIVESKKKSVNDKKAIKYRMKYVSPVWFIVLGSKTKIMIHEQLHQLKSLPCMNVSTNMRVHEEFLCYSLAYDDES